MYVLNRSQYKKNTKVDTGCMHTKFNRAYTQENMKVQYKCEEFSSLFLNMKI